MDLPISDGSNISAVKKLVEIMFAPSVSTSQIAYLDLTDF